MLATHIRSAPQTIHLADNFLVRRYGYAIRRRLRLFAALDERNKYGFAKRLLHGVQYGAFFFDGMACHFHCPNVVHVVECNIYAYIYAFVASYILVIIEKYWQNDLILMFLTTILLAPRTMLSKMKEFLWKTKGIC